MADAEVVETEAAQDDVPNIYERISKQSGIEYDPENYMSVAAYKYEVCNWYQKEFPEDEDFEDPEKVDTDIQELINLTTNVLHENKGARTRAPLPVWDGLPDPDDTDAKPKRRGRAKAADGEGEATEKKTRAVKEKAPPKERGPNRYLRAARALIKNPKLTKAEVAEECDISEIAAGYCIEAFEANYTAFKESGHLTGFDEKAA